MSQNVEGRYGNLDGESIRGDLPEGQEVRLDDSFKGFLATPALDLLETERAKLNHWKNNPRGISYDGSLLRYASLQHYATELIRIAYGKTSVQSPEPGISSSSETI